MTANSMRSPRFVLLALFLCLAMHSMANSQNTPAGQQPKVGGQSGSLSQASVYWVGHSLMGQQSASDWGQIDLMSLVGIFAKAKGLGYHMGDHTLWGTPLSGQWRGRPHFWDRDASPMLAKREAFERSAGTYDTLVLIEGGHVSSIRTIEFSEYYLRRFYCTLKTANPKARVFLYQAWADLQGGGIRPNAPKPAYRNDWRATIDEERKAIFSLADTAARASVRTPSEYRWLNRFGWNSTTDAGCKFEDPIYLVPVGDTFVNIAGRLAQPRPGDHFARPDGSMFKIFDLVANPYVNWPPEWPLAAGAPAIDEKAVLAQLKLRDPAKPHDDIHASLDGIYVAALVHFATLYRQSPLGLPFPASIGEGLARTLQCIAWQTVASTPQAGVGVQADCTLNR